MSKVTIDPENQHEINRLVILLTKNGWRPTQTHGLRDALREIAKPAIPEPMGRAAVVEDFDGRRWVSWRQGACHHKCPWQLVEIDAVEHRDYVDIDVAKVLFDGA